MKNFPNTQSKIETRSVIDNVTNTLHAEWNINKYIGNPELVVNDSIPTDAANEELLNEAEQIQKKFPIESVVESGRGAMSGYVIAGTKYRSVPTYQNQAARSDNSWQNETTWLWYGDHARYKYWVTSLRAGKNGSIPHNTGRILYTWPSAKPVNKLQIVFQKDHAFPVDWEIYVDTAGDQNWRLIGQDVDVPEDGVVNIYRDTLNQPQLPGLWETEQHLWTEKTSNYINCYGIKIVINSVDISYGRPGIISLAPKFEADLSDLMISWSINQELGDSDFINPMGTASANTGSVELSNNTGLFNEHDVDGLLYKLLDEDVNLRGYLTYERDTIQIFDMLSDSWGTEGMNTCKVELVDHARTLQNTKCKDLIFSDVTAGTALHMMFASLGLQQFNLNEVTPKSTTVMEKFFTKKEENVWDIVSELAKGVQMAATFDTSGVLNIFSKEKTFNPDGTIDYLFTSEEKTDRVPDLMSLDRQENSRFNKVTVRYNPVNDYSLSGSRNQILWEAPDTWTIGAAQIVKNIHAGDTYFFIDPNKPEDLPRYSGTVLIEDINHEYDWEGRQYFCKNAPAGEKYIKAVDEAGYAEAVERNGGEKPRFTGKIFLKDDKTFKKDFYSKGYGFRQNWDIIEYKEDSKDGKKMITGAKHSPVDGSLQVKTDYAGSKRLNITKKNKNWNKFDRVGFKFKTKSRAAQVGVVLWPQGSSGASGYYFVVDPMTDPQIERIIKAGGKEKDSISAPAPEIHGFIIKNNGSRVSMDFDRAKDFTEIPPLHVNSWAYLEVAVYTVPGGYDFEVFVNGRYCKTYTDTNIKLTRNEKTGMTFKGIGETLVDKFYVVNYPESVIRSKSDDDGGRIVRRKDLWENRKASPGDKVFTKYLKSLNKSRKIRVFESDFSGRQYGIAREKVTERVRFEEPGLTSELSISNGGVGVIGYEGSAFGARFTLVNHTERNQLLAGEKETKVPGAKKTQSAYIYGKSFRLGEQQEVEYKKESLIDRIGVLPIEFESRWIQSHAAADNIAKWVMDRFGDNAEVYSFKAFGNPLIEIGDIVDIEWPEKGLEAGTVKWCVTKISNSWDKGMTSDITVRRII